MSKKRVVTVGAGCGAFLGVITVSLLVFAFIVAPLIMVAAAGLHLLIPSVPAIGYLTSLLIAGILWVLGVLKRIVFG